MQSKFLQWSSLNKAISFSRYFSLPKNRSSGLFFDSHLYASLPVSHCSEQTPRHWSSPSNFHYSQCCEKYQWLIQSQFRTSALQSLIFPYFYLLSLTLYDQNEDTICTFHQWIALFCFVDLFILRSWIFSKTEDIYLCNTITTSDIIPCISSNKKYNLLNSMLSSSPDCCIINKATLNFHGNYYKLCNQYHTHWWILAYIFNFLFLFSN